MRVFLMLFVLLMWLGLSTEAHAEAKIGPVKTQAEGMRGTTRVFSDCPATDWATFNACITRLKGVATADGQIKTSGSRVWYSVLIAFPVDFVPPTSTPAPVNCVVSAWSAWNPATCVAPATRTRTRTVITPAANGGTACPALSETQTCPTATAFSLKINAGGAASGDYSADQYFTGGYPTNACNRAVSGVYATRRYAEAPSALTYEIPVPKAGTYTARLQYQECYHLAAGLRVMSANIEGVAVPQYDTYRADGSAFTVERAVAVGDGKLTVRLSPVKGDAMVNAIEIIEGGTITPPTPTRGVTLSWIAPTQNTDGTSLTNLAGYRIVYGKSATMLTESIHIEGATSTLFTVELPEAATWYFAIRAYTSGGTESGNSAIVSKSVT